MINFRQMQDEPMILVRKGLSELEQVEGRGIIRVFTRWKHARFNVHS